ncbi:MAG TPA: glycosyltransferase [Micromonosporaceae bacterium]
MSQPTEAGVASYVSSVSADQAERGWRVVVACPDGGRLAGELARRGIDRELWPAGRAPDLRCALEVARLRRLIDRLGPDVIHLHSSKAGLAGRLAARGQPPTLFQPHGWSWLAAPPGLARASCAWERLAAQWTARFVLVGPGEVRHAGEQGLRGRFSIVRTGIDLAWFRPAGDGDRERARRGLGLSTAAPLAVCVGRVTRQKGQDLLLAAWPGVRVAIANAQLAIVGGGELAAPRANAPAGVIFAGDVADTRPWYDAADLVVLPSRWEGMPLTLLEALATGRSVVASDVPGIAEELPAGAGVLVRIGDLAGLASAIRARLGDPDLARREGAVAAAYAQAEVDVRRSHDRLAALTMQVATGRSGGHCRPNAAR